MFKSLFKGQMFRYKKSDSLNIDAGVSAFHAMGARENSLHFPMPMVAIASNLEIVWYNSLFDESIEDIEEFGGIITAELAEVDNTTKNIAFVAELGDKRFDVVGKINYMHKSDDYSIVLYLINRTNEKNLKQELKDTRAVICRLMIDNYDDLVKSIASQSDRKEKSHSAVTEITNRIDEELNAWADILQASILKYEKDRYYLVFRHDKLEEQMKEKFRFFEIFDEMNKQHHVPITVSVGIGDANGMLANALEFADAALDMAMGRGGDQVVIRTPQGFQYFGGRSMEVDKRTKVKPRLVADALEKLLPHNENVFIMGHEGADADVLGAAAGLVALMRAKGLNANVVLDEKTNLATPFTDLLKASGHYDNVFISPAFAVELFNEDDLLILVDCHKASLTQCPELLEMEPQLIIIDHHRRDADFISSAVLTYHEPYASSTAEMVVEILQYIDMGIPLLKEEAQCLYAGIVLDTKNFTFKTGVRTFEAASFLRTSGVDPVSVKRMFQVDKEAMVNRSAAIANSEIYRENIAIAIVDKLSENTSTRQQIGACADALLNIRGVDAGFAVSEGANKTGEGLPIINISARSLGRVNVQLIMEKLGGGGHATSSGGKVAGTLDEVLNKLKIAINEVLD